MTLTILALSNEADAIPSMVAAEMVLESSSLIPVTWLAAPIPKCVLMKLMSKAIFGRDP